MKGRKRNYESIKQGPAPACKVVGGVSENDSVCSVSLPGVTLHLSFRYLEGNHLTAVPKELSALRHLTLM